MGHNKAKGKTMCLRLLLIIKKNKKKLGHGQSTHQKHLHPYASITNDEWRQTKRKNVIKN